MSPPSTTDNFLLKEDSLPWIGTYVIVTKYGSPFKGYLGVVKNVLCCQNTDSGLKFTIQFAHLNPSSPFATTVLDYDDVVKQKSVNFSLSES